LLGRLCPDSPQASKMRSEFDWALAWQQAKEVLEQERQTGVPRVPSLLAAERDAVNALAAEQVDYEAAQALWRELADRSPSSEKERPWIRLAQQMSQRPPRPPGNSPPR